MKLTKALLVVGVGLILATQAQADMLDNYWEEGRPDDATLDFGAVVTYPVLTEGGEGEFFVENIGPGDTAVLLPEGDIPSEIQFYTALDLVTPTLVEMPSFDFDGGGNTGTIEGLADDSQVWEYSYTEAGWVTVTAGAGGAIDTLRLTSAETWGEQLQNIEVIPEPATLALLGLGGLGLLLRRKRR